MSSTSTISPNYRDQARQCEERAARAGSAELKRLWMKEARLWWMLQFEREQSAAFLHAHMANVGMFNYGAEELWRERSPELIAG